MKWVLLDVNYIIVFLILLQVKTVFLCIAITNDIFGESALLANPKKPPIWDDSRHM